MAGIACLCFVGVDEILHAVSAVTLHFLRHMAVGVKCECNGRMAQVFGDGFDIVTVLEGQRSVGVPQIVEAGGGDSNSFGNLLEIVIDLVGDQMPAQLIGEYQIHGILP